MPIVERGLFGGGRDRPSDGVSGGSRELEESVFAER
jgi:hypothetical protein